MLVSETTPQHSRFTLRTSDLFEAWRLELLKRRCDRSTGDSDRRLQGVIGSVGGVPGGLREPKKIRT